MFCYLATCFLFACCLLTGCKTADSNQKMGLYFPKNSKSVVIPFKIANNLMIISLQINDSDTMRFVLDTGVKTAILTELHSEKGLNLQYTRKIKIKGLGSGNDLEAYHSYGNQFRLPKIRGFNQDVLILQEDIFFLSQKLGMPINGLIGYDLFKNFIVEINYESERIILHNPERYKPKNKGKTILMEIDNGKPYIKGKIMIENQEVDVKLLIDTGASHSISLEQDSSKQIFKPSKTIEAYLGKGLSGEVRGSIGRIKSFSLGNYQLKNITTSFPDTASMHGMGGLAGRNGNIGGDLLKRFHLIFNYEKQELTLYPNKKFKEIFNHNLSGIEISMPILGLNHYVIAEVSPNTPAQEAGLLRGDEIVSINGQSAFRFDLNDMNQFLQEKVGKKINLIIKRGNEIMKKNFVLRAMI